MAKWERLVQFRNYEVEEQDGEMILEGYATVFNQPTVLYTDERGNEYKEVIDRNAFNDCDMSKCCLKYNHESSVPVMARVRGGSLELSVDDYGLKFRAKLFNTSTSRDVYELVKEGGIDECSFAFTIATDGADYNGDTRTRTIRSIGHLWDVAVVDNPAYGGTSVSARSFFEMEIEKEALENEKRSIEEKKRKALELKLMLLEV